MRKPAMGSLAESVLVPASKLGREDRASRAVASTGRAGQISNSSSLRSRSVRNPAKGGTIVSGITGDQYPNRRRESGDESHQRRVRHSRCFARDQPEPTTPARPPAGGGPARIRQTSRKAPP